MRLTTGFLLLVLTSACGGPRGASSPDAAASADLATASDLAAPADLTLSTGPLGCRGYVACLAACGSNAPCASDCAARVTKEGKAVFDDGVGCGQAFCLDTTLGPARCVQSGGALVDPTDTPQNTCQRCLSNALAAYFGASCTPIDSPDCNPEGCTFTIAECQASKP